jgi:hypothetical protein
MAKVPLATLAEVVPVLELTPPMECQTVSIFSTCNQYNAKQ